MEILKLKNTINEIKSHNICRTDQADEKMYELESRKDLEVIHQENRGTKNNKE